MKDHIEDQRLNLRHIIAESDMPRLIGSSQDIDWATPIRVELLLGVNTWIAQLQSQVTLGQRSQAQLDETMQASHQLQKTTLASWWIASRNQAPAALLEELSHRSYAMEYGEQAPR